MKETIKALTTAFYSSVIVALVIVLLFETGLIATGIFADNTTLCFVVASTMELVTIAIIPFALRLFKFKAVEQRLTDSVSRWDNLRRFGLLRILLLSVPMIINLLCYYLFMSKAFVYLAIILFLCMFFVYPSVDKCVAETTRDEGDKN